MAKSRPRERGRPSAAHAFEYRQVLAVAPEFRVTAQAVHRLVKPSPILEPEKRLAALARFPGWLTTIGAMPAGPKARPAAAGAVFTFVPEARDLLRGLLRGTR
jgi:hypothetical protein